MRLWCMKSRPSPEFAEYWASTIAEVEHKQPVGC